jgi:(p)ppGpp synthase/HD superfamily hydrolase
MFFLSTFVSFIPYYIVLNLKAGSTALDAAFNIHTAVGLSTTGRCHMS